MTVLEVIQETITLLEDTSIPAKYLDSIGKRVGGAIGNLRAIEGFMKEQAAKAETQEAEETQAEEPVPEETPAE